MDVSFDATDFVSARARIVLVLALTHCSPVRLIRAS
jgi:hypothetical protein